VLGLGSAQRRRSAIGRRDWAGSAAGVLAASVALAALTVLAICIAFIAVHGPAVSPILVAGAAGVIALAQFARLPVRIEGKRVLLAWGEAGTIVTLCLLPAVWVPVAGAAGAVIGHAYRLRSATRPGEVLRVWYAVCVLSLGAAAAAGVRIVAIDPNVSIKVGRQPGALGVVLLAGLAYFGVTSLLTAALPALLEQRPVGQVWRAAVRGERGVLAANIAVGLLMAVLMGANTWWLATLPPVLWLVHEAYGQHVSAADDRDVWEAYAEATRKLNQHDEHSVILAALQGMAPIFGPARAELTLVRPSGRRRRYRVGEGWTDDPVGPAVPRFGRRRAGPDLPEWPRVGTADPAHALTRPLTVRGLGIGELSLWFDRPTSLAPREDLAFSAYADAVASALHDAQTQRELQAMTERSAYEAVHDPLTGLPNRSALLARGTAVLNALDPAATAALVLFDVDGLHEVNDTLGPAAGDELLQQVARRLAVARRPSELLGHLGDDEYALMLVDEEEAVRRAKALTVALAAPARIAGVLIAVEVSAGVVVGPAGGATMGELLRRADVALYQAKRSGARVAVYDPATDRAGAQRLDLLAELRDALATTDQIGVWFQPVVDLTSLRPIAVEALVRWQHPRRGVLGPAEFVDVIDQSDLVAGFTRYVLDLALRYVAPWGLAVSVNLGVRSLLDRGLPEVVAGRLAAHGVAPQRLILEITETVMTSELSLVDEVVSGLRGMGVRVCVDDFGTGSSSLAFLTRVPVDVVKIDRSFVALMGTTPEATAIVRTTIELSQELNLQVIAEGVETAEQRARLVALGVTAGQGYFFHRPMPPDAMANLLGSG
jgi:diguanylate cyclase (GGDEF)-like protein